MTNMIHTHSFDTPEATGLLAALANPALAAAAIVRSWKHRREMNRLLSMPDYLLKDIGLQRGDIQREALEPWWAGAGQRQS